MSELRTNKILNTASGTSVKVDRTSSDGDIVELQKDGTTVGSIGTYNGTPNFEDSANEGIRISTYSLIKTVAPSSSGANNDNDINLGSSSNRWKDLYLGGNIYLGGTTSANALDDYEEGTFNVTVSGSTSGSSTYTARGQYTKVGRLCIATYSLDPVTFPTFTGNLQFGLPFTSSSGPVEFRGPDIYFYPNGNWDGVTDFGGVNPKVNSGQGVLVFNVKKVDGDRQTTLSSSNSTLSGASGIYARFSITYATQ